MPRDNRCMYMAHVCFYVCCSDCVVVWEVCCVAAVVKDSVFLALEYVVCLGKGCDGCYDWKIYSISNKSTKTIQVQLYTIAKKKRHEMHIFEGRVNGKERNVLCFLFVL